MKTIPWGRIVKALETWRRDLGDPSVTTVAEQYSRDPWAVLVSTILSLRTKDEVTLAASARLLKQAGSPAALYQLGEEAIAALAYPAGFYRTKASNLKKIAAILLEQYGGRVPADMEALLALPGVGRKTANLVLIEAFDLPGICVDVHVHRICNRAGWIATKNPEETETVLRACLPRQYWKGINALLVLYGQQTCRPLSPHCSRCVITPYCRQNGVAKSR
ncbi:MAG: endonuclease III [Treponema sp.]|jgi:endonuclease-3|nr:endonuclease III [Treponema sp.]